MSDSLITIVAIFLAAILMFVFPLMSVAERSVDASELTVQTAVTDFVDTARTKGEIDWTSYNNLVSTLNATGYNFDIEMEHKVLDENVGKKSAWKNGQVIGENVYYSVFTTQILDKMSEDGGSKSYKMNEGDILTVTAKNTNTTLAQNFRSMFYSITGSGSSELVGTASGLVVFSAK